MQRRQVLRLLATAVPLAGLSACGFRLRGNATFAFKRLYTTFGEDSAFGAELARNVRSGSDAVVVTDPKQADAVLEVLETKRDKVILSRNADGQVREYRLSQKLRFRVHDGKGKELLKETEIALTQDVSFNESAVLAKDYEEALLFRTMQTDLIQQLMRRLEAVKPQ